MGLYDFSRLNDKEFEELCADIISEIEDVRVERFKPGKDSGIDGRFFKAGKTAILQCKHYILTGFKGLISSLKKTESDKVKKLAPHRYIFFTSCNLSPANKQEIKKIFHPYILKDQDIFGLNDIENSLENHPGIERKHYKLWLSSSNILKYIIHNGILGKSDDFIDQLKNESKFYYKTSDYEKTVRKLETTGVSIITGAPGVGKTTLANQMCLHYIALDYSIIYIDDDLSEAQAVFDPDEKQFFYFDDFLGRNYLDALENKADSKVINFIKRVIRSKNKRFILTSRSSILNKGKELSEILRWENITNHEYEVHIDNLNEYDKANILYNHLWHSGLDNKYIEAIYMNKNYNAIIKHKNFNPRLISFITDPYKLVNVKEKDYWEYISSNLNNPEEIWGNLFNNQIASEVRYLTILTSLNNSPIDEIFLRDAFYNLISKMPGYNMLNHRTFEDHIRVAVKSTLSRTIDKNDEVTYNIFNPSLGDFIINKYKDNLQLLKLYFNAINTSACLYNLYSLKKDVISKKTFKEIAESIANNIDPKTHPHQTISLIYLHIISEKNADIDSILLKKSLSLKSLLSYSVTITTLTIIKWIIEKSSQHFSKEDIEIFIINNLLSEYEDDNLILISEIAKAISADSYLFDLIKSHVIHVWKEDIQRKADEIDDMARIYSYKDVPQGKAWLTEDVYDALKHYPIQFSADDIKDIVDSCDFEKIIEYNIEIASRDHEDIDTISRRPVTDYTIAIEDLFDRS